MEELTRALNEFKSIQLNELDNANLMDRVDTKFAFSRLELNKILLELLPDYFCFEINEMRIGNYQSLYFDKECFDFYNDHHNGKIHRFKVRFRKYVDSDIYFLEVKEKQKGRVTKRRIPVTRFEQVLQEEQRAFVDNILGEKTDLEPKLWNTYKRITLVSKNKKERLTLDLDIKFSWKEESKEFDDIVIAELKQERLDRSSPFYQLMRKRSIRPYRLSKYCIGAIELHTKRKLKYNRFKKKLLKLKEIKNDTRN
jgi:hypothetical protein